MRAAHGIHPYSLARTLQNPLARMLPLGREQAQVYRLGDKNPPWGELPHAPMWEAVSLVLGARQTLQARINLQRNFTLISVATSASSVINGGFRAQLYDMRKKRTLMDRGLQQALMGGNMLADPGAFFLREPYCFDQPDSQILVMVQNAETVTNTIQIALYGQVLRFNEPGGRPFPGGSISSGGR